MSKYSLAHLSQEAVLTGVKAHLGRERGSLALVLAHIGEIETQEYYKPAGYSSVHMYCVHELHLSKDAAYKRITAARLARRFPVIFEKVAEGALRLTAVNILAAHLEPENVEELLSASAFRSDFEVREILAERFPQAPAPTTIEPIGEQTVLAPSQESVSEHAGLAAQRVQRDVNPLLVKPIAADQYRATFTMSRRFRDKLRHLKDLLGYRKTVPDEAEMMETAVDIYIAQVEKRKFGSPDRPQRGRRSKSSTHVSTEVRRQVFERDGSRCTFTSEDGVRCPETRGLECDHIEPVARGGDSRPSNLRLRCRAHNQLEAERTFGKEFMQNKREKAKAAKGRGARAAGLARNPEEEDRTIWWLGIHGHKEEDARWALNEVGPQVFPFEGALVNACLQVLRVRAEAVRPRSA